MVMDRDRESFSICVPGRCHLFLGQAGTGSWQVGEPWPCPGCCVNTVLGLFLIQALGLALGTTATLMLSGIQLC